MKIALDWKALESQTQAMWRQNTFPGNSDSDQSISDEEGFEGVSGVDCASWTRNPQEEERLQVPSQLEVLRGTGELSCGGKEISSLINQKHASLLVDDEVEMPNFPNEDGINFPTRREALHALDKDIISDDEDSCAAPPTSITSRAEKSHNDQGFGSMKHNMPHTPPMMSKTLEALIHVNEHAIPSHSAQSKAKKATRGVRVKAKPRFSFHFQSHGVGLSRPYSSKEEATVLSEVHDMQQILEETDLGFEETPDPKHLQSFFGETENEMNTVPTDSEAPRNGFIEHSMTELLDGLQDKSVQLRKNYKLHTRSAGKGPKLATKRSTSLLGDKVVGYEDQYDPLASGSSSDDGSDHQNLKLANPEMKGQTMADRFQEALANSTVSKEGPLVLALKPSGVGLFGKLQQVMQSQKERDADFLKKLQMGASPNDEPHSFVVKIVSRYLEAKLSVCYCSLIKNVKAFQDSKSSKSLEDREMNRKIIFSPRVCNDVDLDVGNLICIHFPWKEVQVTGDDESIILSSYFSHISFD